MSKSPANPTDDTTAARSRHKWPLARQNWGMIWRLWCRSLWFLLPGSLLTGSLIVISHMTEIRTDQQNLLIRESIHIKLGHSTVENIFSSVDSDLQLLANSKLLNDYLKRQNKATRMAISQEFVQFARFRQRYDQIRFLDAKGKEQIRVNFNQGQPSIVPSDQLQDKRDRYYFTLTIELEQNQVYVSPLDLNIEQGKIEYPLKPMLRFGTPIFDDRGTRRGILVLNYFGDRLLTQLRNFIKTADNQPMLVNTDGYWLLAPDPMLEWGFMLDHNQNFQRQYPEVWQQILAQEQGQLITPQGIFTFITITPLTARHKARGAAALPARTEPTGRDQQSYSWKLVNYVPNSVLQAERWRHITQGLQEFLVLLFALVPLSLVAAWFSLRNEEHDRLYQLSQAKVQALEDVNLLKDDFLSTVSHDLRSPLSNIKMGTQMLRSLVNRHWSQSALVMPNDALSQQIERYLDVLAKECDRELALVNDLLDLQRLTAGAHDLVKESVDLNLWLPEMLEIFQERMAQRKLQLTIQMRPVPAILVDPRALHRVVEELLTNAYKYTPPGDRIDIQTSMVDNQVQLTVTNYGVSIPSSELGRIFDKFYRVPGHDQWRQGGTGLGLTLAKQLVEEMDGNLTVTSGQQETSFILIFSPLSETSFSAVCVSDGSMD